MQIFMMEAAPADRVRVLHDVLLLISFCIGVKQCIDILTNIAIFTKANGWTDGHLNLQRCDRRI